MRAGFCATAKASGSWKGTLPLSRTWPQGTWFPARFYTEIQEGRGINGQDYVYLDLTHLGEKKLAERLSDISSFVKIYLGLNPATDPIPVHPTCHYMMGGIAVNADGNVTDVKNNPVPGLYAAGECSCISLHGANRLGCNSLLDLVVFGRRAGQHIMENLSRLSWVEPPRSPERDDGGQDKTDQGKQDRRKACGHTAVAPGSHDGRLLGVSARTGFEKGPRSCKGAGTTGSANISIDNMGNRFNTDLIDALELQNMLAPR